MVFKMGFLDFHVVNIFKLFKNKKELTIHVLLDV